MIEEDYDPNEIDKRTISDKSGIISVGKNVIIVDRKPDFVVKNNSSIEIGSNCKIDRGVRLLTNNGATLFVGDNTRIGLNTVINAGCDVSIGCFCLISGMVYIQASNHKYLDKNVLIQRQGYNHGPIRIGNDVWIASHVTITKGVTIGSGAVIGANSVVNRNVECFEVVAGVPIKHIKYRE